MSEHEQDETLPEESVPQGEAQEERPSDFEGEKRGKGGEEGHGSGEHETVNI